MGRPVMSKDMKKLYDWIDFLYADVSPKDPFLMSKVLEQWKIYKENDGWENDLNQYILLLVIERLIEKNYNIDVKKLLEISKDINNDKNICSKNIVEYVIRYLIDNIADNVSKREWHKASILLEKLENINTDKNKIPVSIKLMFAEVWEHECHNGRAKCYYKDALFNRKPISGCYCVTPYTLLLCMLVLPDWKNTAFILGEKMSDKFIYKFMKYNVAGLYSLKWTLRTDVLRDILKEFAQYCKKNKIIVYGQDHRADAGYFIDENFIVVEDGTANYTPCTMYTVLANGYEHIPFGYDNMINTVYLTGRMVIPNELKRKVKLIDIKKIWEDKNETEKDEILDIFSVPLNDIVRAMNSGKTYIFLTTSIFAHDYNEEKKQWQVELFSRILSKYDMKRIIIKVHHFDPVDYEKIFPECFVVREQFPIEILKLVGLENKISKIISIGSTAIHGIFNKTKIDNYENFFKEEFYKKWKMNYSY